MVSFGGITALDGVSVEVSPGEVLGVIGPNGAGKTTLFNVICGFVRPSKGTLSWRGQPMVRVAPDRLASIGIARTLQGVGLFPGLTVLENVMVGAQRFRKAPVVSAMLGLPWSDRDERRQRDRALAALARSAATTSPTGCPERCPTPSRSGSRWRGRSCPSPSCCSSTSPPAASTRASCRTSAS